MKNLLATFALTLLSLTAAAQASDIRDKVLANPELARGHYYVNPNVPGPQTSAPEGYEAFYVSHFARHGARYCWEDIYTRLDTTLRKAHDAGHLTEKGESVYQGLHSNMPELSWHTGELSLKGWAQHRQSAKNICTLYPEIFGTGAEIIATSSNSERCAMSMASYCNEVARNYPDVSLYEYISRTDYDCVLPTSSHNPQLMDIPSADRPFELKGFLPISNDDVLLQYFDDLDYVKTIYKYPGRMLSDLYTYWCCVQECDEDIRMDDPFTPEQEEKNWEQGNLFSFMGYYSNRYKSWPVLADIVEKADKRIAAGIPGADLRFSHDTHFGPLLCLLDAGGNGTVAISPEEQYKYFQDYNVCMASNFHFIFYRSDRNPEILFKLLLNSVETTLPLESVTGPYYRWSDFKEMVKRLKEEADALHLH